MLVVRIWYLLLCVAIESQSYKILVFAPILSKSNHLLLSDLVYELASKGHELTFYHAFSPQNTTSNVKEATVSGFSTVFKGGLSQTLINMAQGPQITRAQALLDFSYSSCSYTLQRNETQKFLGLKQNFDLVVLFEYAFHSYLGILQHFDAPVVFFNNIPLLPFTSFRFGNPSLPSFLPNSYGAHLDNSKFFERLSNSFQHLIYILYDQLVSYPKHKALAREYIPGSPDIDQYSQRQNFILINSHKVISESLPLLPNSVEIGGLNLKNPQVLPQNLEKVVTSSPDGVVLFSLGTYMNIADLPKTILREIFDVLGKFPQMFLIKWTAELPAFAPKNLHFSPWLPQNDLLAHPNIRGFITHGGIFSIMESVSNAVPIIGIPIIFDQSKNMDFVENQGFGISIPFSALSGTVLQAALTQLLSNATLLENVQKKSKILRDPAKNYLDSTIFWLEYVIRHDGAHYLRYNGGKLVWYQRYLLDVLAIIVLLLFLLFLVLQQLMNIFSHK